MKRHKFLHYAKVSSIALWRFNIERQISLVESGGDADETLEPLAEAEEVDRVIICDVVVFGEFVAILKVSPLRMQPKLPQKRIIWSNEV